MGKRDTYNEIALGEICELKIKGSRFIGESFLVRSVSEAEDALHDVRKREFNATHHCWAYRLGIHGNEFRYSDDGEPKGTAGLPILRQIEGVDVTNTLVIVTRYYGGTKLGTGGLARAYGDAAKEVLTKSKSQEKILRVDVIATFSYDDTSGAMHTIGNFDIKITGSDYGNKTKLHLAVRLSEYEGFTRRFTEKLRGRGQLLQKDLPG